MNRNNEAHFNQIPQTYISRSRFKRDQDIKLTFDAGKLIPFYVDEVLPGDTFSVDTAGIVRMTTPIFPVMDNAYLDLYYFFVPNRIVWEHWKEFCGENTSGAWEQTTQYTVPQITIGNKQKTSPTATRVAAGINPAERTVLDYMGVPTKINKNTSTEGLSINALPVRGYVKIWNEWFRDQNVDDPVTEKKGDTATEYTSHTGTAYTQTQLNEMAAYGDECLPVNKFHDYFTSCLPAPQKGPAVSIALSGNAAVYYGNGNTGKIYTVDQLIKDLSWTSETTGTAAHTSANYFRASSNPVSATGKARAVMSNETTGGVNLVADLSNVEATTINELRQAFAVQHYYEALARGGSRFPLSLLPVRRC